MSEWISVDESVPKNEDGKWSDPVAVVTDTGDVFGLSFMSGYWQRSAAFIDSGSTTVLYWSDLPKL